MTILYKILGVVVLLAAVFGAGFFAGQERCRTKQEKAATKQLQSDSEVVVKLEDSKDKRDVIVRERVKVIYATIDNCIGQRAPDSVLDGLR